jgi:hypothetical protein
MGAHFSEMHMSHDNLVDRVVQLATQAAERTGEVTFDQLNALLPSTPFAAEQVTQVLNRLAERGIRIVDH